MYVEPNLPNNTKCNSFVIEKLGYLEYYILSNPFRTKTTVSTVWPVRPRLVTFLAAPLLKNWEL